MLHWTALGALGAVSAAAPVSAASNLRLPSGAMLLSRRLVRDLRDGEEIIVDRAWEVRFKKTTRRYEIAGRQVSAHVEAPAQLKALADIEQSRRNDGMFPIALSEAGLLVGGAPPDGSAAITMAVNAARQMIAQSTLSLPHKAQSNQHLLQMQQAAQPLIDTLPADLFFPSKPPIFDTQTVDLPDGSVGEFEIRYEATSVPQGGWLDHAKRRIVTRLGSSERHSSEYWTLAPA